MNHSVQDSPTPMLRLLKEIYLTAFTIFFRVGGADWTPSINGWRSVVCITLIEWFVLLGIGSWVDMFIGTQFLLNLSKWGIRIAFLVLCFVNYYVLVACSQGVEFEREFSHLKKSRKVLLVTSSVAIMLAAIVFFIYSAIVHRHFLGVDKP
jgi:hypothetical protein